MAADVVLRTTAALAVSDPLIERARKHAGEAHSKSTRRNYSGAVARFCVFCEEKGVPALPAAPDTVAAYITHLEVTKRKAATIELALTAINQWHVANKHKRPRRSAVVQKVRRGIRRTIGTKQTEKAPLLIAELRAAVTALPDSFMGKRDRAILLLGFAGAFRRSELVSLNVDDVRFVSSGALVSLGATKTDQEGRGTELGIPRGAHPETCPVRALQAWLEASGRADGPLFVSLTRWGHQRNRLRGADVALIVQRSLLASGMDEDEAKLYSGHSMRAGLATQAALMGKSEHDIGRQTRHRSVAMIRKYVRKADVWMHNAADGIGL